MKPDEDRGDVLAVVTSCGYLSEDESDSPRVLAFVASGEDVRMFYASLDSNIVRQLFNADDSPVM